MNCLFLRRGYPETATDITVTITGTGHSTYCYATIGGTKRYGAGSYTVHPNDLILFGIYGTRRSDGWLRINGTDILTVSDLKTHTYIWTVPTGINSISMSMDGNQNYGRITVTTA